MTRSPLPSLLSVFFLRAKQQRKKKRKKKKKAKKITITYEKYTQISNLLVMRLREVEDGEGGDTVANAGSAAAVDIAASVGAGDDEGAAAERTAKTRGLKQKDLVQWYLVQVSPF